MHEYVTFSAEAVRFAGDRKQRGMTLDERHQARREIEEFFHREADAKAVRIMSSAVCNMGNHGACVGESVGVGCLCLCHDTGQTHE